MRELLPLGAMKKEQLPVYLTTWGDKTSPLCMYTVTHTRAWSNAHLKAGCWYLDCGKVFFPLKEEDVKKACGQADSKDAATDTNQGDEQQDEVEEDINPLSEKEKTRAAAKKKKADEKALKDVEKTKKGEKLGKKKPSPPPVLLTKASTAIPS